MRLKIEDARREILQLDDLNPGEYFTFTDRSEGVVYQTLDPEDMTVVDCLGSTKGIPALYVSGRESYDLGTIVRFLHPSGERPVRRLLAISMEFKEVI